VIRGLLSKPALAFALMIPGLGYSNMDSGGFFRDT
jgi:hypothetical protein